MSPVVKRRLSLVAVVAVLASFGVLVAAPPASATPVATNQTQYNSFGRVFPDPHGCQSGPDTSPWAKGNVCATQFVQWDEALQGLAFLESKFGRYLDVVNLRTEFGGDPFFQGLTLQSAGLPTATLQRDRRDLYAVKVTDSLSPIPESERKHFAYALSIHGIERAGLEGGIRAAEDVVTWAACEENPQPTGVPACATEGPFPKRILEPMAAADPNARPNPTAGEVVRGAVTYFILANPDGWHRGEFSEGGVFFQRYNGNGMDLNRDWPTKGYVQADYTPWSEPETVGFGRYLEYIRNRTDDGRFDGAIDLHGMLTAPSFSFTLLGAGQRDYRKNQRTVETSILTFRDSEARLDWSSLIAPAGECPGDVEEPVFGGTVPMCSDQWGTVWDTINYQVTGSFGDWMDSDLGLDAVGIDNEMALSHITPNQAFHDDVEQLHIDGNKGLIYSQIASLLDEQPVVFDPKGKTGYVFDPRRITNAGIPDHGDHPLPAQPSEEHIETNATPVVWEVKDETEGFHNGGMYLEATCTNVSGIGGCAGAGFVSISFNVQYCGNGASPGECTTVTRYFNQSPIYEQAGLRVDLNDPQPGWYRVQPNAARPSGTRVEIFFTEGHSYPEPHQAPYDVSRMDFFTELNRYVPDSEDLQAVNVGDVLRRPKRLRRFDTLIVTDEFMPGASGFSEKKQRKYVRAMSRYALRGGNLVLTDGAMGALPSLGTGIPAEAVTKGYFYAGWVDFDDGKGPTYDRHHLSFAVNKEGTAEGRATVSGQTFDNRHQMYEPVPIGYYVGPGGSSNSSCNRDRCDSPNWIVDQQAWERAGGTTAGRTLVRLNKDRPESGEDPTRTGVSLGELPFGAGTIRIVGALLPTPTEENHHPFGLSSYALTYTGYQVFENAIDPRQVCPPAVGAGGKRIVGTSGRDKLLATPGPDVICALGGKDLVRARGGNDKVFAGGGPDKVFGGSGKDRLQGQGGRDFLRGGGGPDRLNGGRGNDFCHASRDEDRASRCERGRLA